MSVAEVSESSQLSTVSKSLWIPGAPLGEASLIVVSNADRENVSLNVFDSDGAIANSLEIELVNFPAVVSIDMLVANIKRDSGFRHGQMQVQHSSSATVAVHLHSNASAVALPAPTELVQGSNFFLPVSFGASKTPLLAIVNGGEHEAVVKLRLFCGNRMPELMVSIPARGARVVALGTEFSEYTAFSADKEVHGYVRLHMKSEGAVGVSFIEVNGSAAADAIFSVVR